MQMSVKTRAEEQFAATQKKVRLALKEKEIEQRERAEHIAKLRALRLAKEAADKEAAEKAEADKAAAKKALARKAAARKAAARKKK